VDLQPQYTVKARVFSGSHVSPATVFELRSAVRCALQYFFAAAGYQSAPPFSRIKQFNQIDQPRH